MFTKCALLLYYEYVRVPPMTTLQMATTLQTSDHSNELKKEFRHGTLTLC